MSVGIDEGKFSFLGSSQGREKKFYWEPVAKKRRTNPIVLSRTMLELNSGTDFVLANIVRLVTDTIMVFNSSHYIFSLIASPWHTHELSALTIRVFSLATTE